MGSSTQCNAMPSLIRQTRHAKERKRKKTKINNTYLRKKTRKKQIERGYQNQKCCTTPQGTWQATNEEKEKKTPMLLKTECETKNQGKKQAIDAQSTLQVAAAVRGTRSLLSQVLPSNSPSTMPPCLPSPSCVGSTMPHPRRQKVRNEQCRLVIHPRHSTPFIRILQIRKEEKEPESYRG